MAVDVVARLRLRGEDFSRGVRTAFAGVPGEADRAGRAAGTRLGAGIKAGLTGAVAGIGIGSIITEIAQLTTRSIEFANEISTTSKAVNAGAVDLQVYRAAARDLGLATREADEGLQKMFEAIVKSGDATSDQAQAFNTLGIAVRDIAGNARPTTAVLGDVVDALREIPDPLRQAELGGKLFGDQFKTLAPLLAASGDGFRALTGDVQTTVDVLSAQEIAELQRINQDFDDLKNTLSVSIARVVSENAESIISLTGSLVNLGIASVNALNDFVALRNGLGNIGQIEGFGAKLKTAIFDPGRAVAAGTLPGLRDQTIRELGGLRSEKRNPTVKRSSFSEQKLDAEIARKVALLGQIDAQLGTDRRRAAGRDNPFQTQDLFRPASTPLGNVVPFTPRARGGGGGRGRAANDNSATREAEKLAREWERIAEATAKQLGDARETAEVEALRAAGLDRQADLQEALGRIASANSAIAGKSAKQIAEEFKVSEEAAARLVAMLAEIARLAEVEIDLKIDAQRLEKFERDFADFADQLGQRASETIEAAAETQQRQFEDLSDTFYTLFSGGADDFWTYFKRRGSLTLADLAAELTLGFLSGDKIDGKGIGDSLKSLFSSKPGDLGSILEKGALGSRLGGAIGLKQSNTGAAIGSVIGSAIPQLGPFGAAIGGAIGGALGGALKSVKRGSATLGVGQFGQLGTTSVRGNSAQFKSAASGSVDALGSQLDQIAEALGGRIDGSRASVSIGIRDGKFRVDTSGQGRTKTKRGAIDFGDDEQAAIAFALGDAIKDGVITGISAASTKILQSGQDIQTALEKALLIEDLPKRLRARLDPLGAALDEVDRKFVKLAEALREGGGSAEQIAQARQLWELERADTVREVGQASAVLADYLKTLRIGPDSPLSLRQQAADAAKAFAPFEEQIRKASGARATLASLEAQKAAGGAVTDADIAAAKSAAAAAAAAIDQTGFRENAALLLDVQRQLGGSTRVFFDQFDRVQELTNQAIALVDGAVPLRGETKDPFAELTANSTKATANILDQHTGILVQQSNYLEQIMRAFELSGARFALDPRGFVDRAA